ncbi:hypothetical protein V6N12_051244 [Hibiscus sabdariffa]|uniref:Uncharacterized protein n=1 Tax=Hibiscus sabdariffa TaxID=183260 RepID=A0ABR2GER4_9ROSI
MEGVKRRPIRVKGVDHYQHQEKPEVTVAQTNGPRKTRLLILGAVFERPVPSIALDNPRVTKKGKNATGSYEGVEIVADRAMEEQQMDSGTMDGVD